MRTKIYQVDAFASETFKGNPAAVCILEQWLDDGLMQSIAMENNLSETAFAVHDKDHYSIRWFTPNSEVDLCGHATLATAYVLFTYYNSASNEIAFNSDRSGPLAVTRKGELLTLDFPADPPQEIEPVPALIEALGTEPIGWFKGKTDFMLVYESEPIVACLEPDFNKIAEAGGRGTIVTAPGIRTDFVSRFFAPQCAVDEDPVTGSAHTTLTPYWATAFNKIIMDATQLSERGGELTCELAGSRVKISGKVAPYLVGEITI